MDMKALILAALLFATPAFAQVTPQMCQPLAEFAGQVALSRDIGANVEKHVTALRAMNAELAAPLLGLLEKVMRGVYASNAPGEVLAFAVYQWCVGGGGGEPV